MSGKGSPSPSVTTIILNYNAAWETMDKCLASLARQTYDNNRILLVDNASTKDILDRVAKGHPSVEIARLDRNYGFSGGINRGVALADSEYVCLLNFDTVAEPDFLAEMVAVASSDERIAGVAPKMMLDSQPGIFDSVGTAMGPGACAFNLAIGQPDIGQYDISEHVFGACFGAALIRRDAFRPEDVGPLDESFFMYFEDVDWCYRANLLGHRFATAPRALVHHEHSASVKDKDYDYKYKLIELNLLRTAVKNYQRRQSVMICVRRLRRHLQNALLNDIGRRGASFAIIAGFLLDLPSLLPRRWEVQRRRQVKDTEILGLSLLEKPFYDPVKYEPEYSLEALIAAYRRVHVLRGDAESFRIWQELEGLALTELKFEPDVAGSRLEELLAGQPEHVSEFAARVKMELATGPRLPQN